MGIPIISTLVPQNGASFPTHDSQYGKGGLMSVTSEELMDAIPVLRRTAGMVCVISTTQDLFILNSDLVTWNLFQSGGGGGSVPTITTIDLAGETNITLTDQQYLSSILVLTGTLTSNVTVYVPPIPNSLVLCNYTSGDFVASMQTTNGAPVIVAQGFQSEVISDGLDCKFSNTDFSNVALGSGATAITQEFTDNSNAIATTAFVQGQGFLKTAPVTSVFARTGDVVLTQEDVDPFIEVLDGGSY